ncbi:OmpA family protein [Thalassotalea sp. M1531]|uniref:OmpA family protein n=1 Tax=Thalassotalea algicola TaxID=2716224 RepID=A0A7Y0LEZ0_9GAMM|nr:OmpA family protein [Thalassotalea algicola]NMP32446.1 OmpA family protein [Thalassotalea algicola]
MKFNKVSLALIAVTLGVSSYAAEQPEASVLVGQTYGGIHYSLFEADSDRVKYEDIGASSLDDGDGFGGELGYRFSESNELRIKYTDLSIDTHKNYGEQDGSATALDLLYFPDKKNLYLLGGFNRIDLREAELSANVGLGYRYYFSNRFAAYVEAKGNYQIEDHFKDFSSSIGVMYFFGENKPAPIKTTTPQSVVEKVEKDLDQDKDGVLDDKDNCADTPLTHLVDIHGCTLFSEKVKTMELVINFDNASSKIHNDYLPQLEKVVSFLTSYPAINLTIEGHTSALGSKAYNQQLSLERSQAVVDKLVNDFGIDSARLNAVGYGEERLINQETSEIAHAQNRRIMATMQVVNKVAVKK